ncbi:glycoside hydrolase superfamily [Clohesyomyces aquaticus]|uniref:Alpha-galactosidase n=1 Tax=Clohesyomyces aquaticus TaxID=1231657 RepID=A0A1Y1ZF94_9PLEO|nr:glycoside hydrolase superfamily [Clohesyomyces aquaticus]
MANSHSSIVIAAGLSGVVSAINNGLAITPPMGWNNWNAFGCDVSENLLLSTSQQILSLGLRDLGYNYVVLDDCWQDPRGRDQNGKLQPEASKFPSGLKSISDHLHRQGFKYGMYSSAGEMTCARFAEGSLDHEVDDANSFAEWGVDMLKYDSCYHMGRVGTPTASFNRFKAMSDALKSTGRNILLNLCNWGEDLVHTWGMSISNSWRITGDIYDSFTRPDDLCGCNTLSPGDVNCVAPGTHCSVLFILNKVAPFADRSIPGGWSDLDMLEVGQGGMTDEEYKAHFALWAALKSPLFLGNDLRSVSASALTILNNPAIIALSQDPHGRSVTRVQRDVVGVPKDNWGVGETHVWSGYLHNGDQVVILLNAGDEDMQMSVSLAEIFVAFGPGGSAPHVKSDWALHDLWAHRMSDATAEALLAAKTEGERSRLLKKANWYNATEIPYAQGLANDDPRLFGEKVGVVEAGGVMKVDVKRHAAKVLRLRRVKKEGESFKAKGIAREERHERDEL